MTRSNAHVITSTQLVSTDDTMTARVPSTPLPALIHQASVALASAKTSGEVLEARDLASAAYDAAKSAGRIARAREAHEVIIAAVHRAQRDALLIEARAKMRLADEYDAAQERGEVRTRADNQLVADDNKLSSADLGLRRDQIHEARQLRDAEAADPGRAERVLSDMADRGQEPTKAAFRREMGAARPSGVSGLSREALEDDVNGLRAEVAELRDKLSKATAERDDFKARLKEATADNQGAVIGKLQKQVQAAKYARDEAMAATKRIEFRLKKAEARVAELERTPIDMEAA